MTIQDQIAALQKEILSFIRQDSTLERQIEQLESSRSTEAQVQKNRYTEKRNALLAQKDDLAKIYRVAKENTFAQLGSRCRSKPDLALLNSLIYSINPNDRNDPVATRIVKLCDQYIQYIDNELANLSMMLQNDIRNADDEISRKISELVQKRQRLLPSFKRHLLTTDCADIGRRTERVARVYDISDAGQVLISKHAQRAKKIVFGYKETVLQTVPALDPILSICLGKYYDPIKKVVILPVGLQTNHSRTIRVRYSDVNEEVLEKGVQALIINLIRYMGPDRVLVNLIDTINYSEKFLGQLVVFSGGKEAVLQHVPHDSDEIDNLLSSLTSYYRAQESITGPNTLFEYNEHHQEKLPMRLIVVNRPEDLYTDSQNAQMSYLINNSEKHGIFFIILEKMNGREMSNESSGKTTKKQLIIQGELSGEFFIVTDTGKEAFTWNTINGLLSNTFIDSVKGILQAKKLSTEYFTNFTKCIPSRSIGTRRPIQVPFALDDDDNIVFCAFEEDNFAAYMMGAARSGKTTLLHTIICGLIMNYHPDEVELWMMDYKMVEFSLYLDYAPPHIKYLLLEKSEDLVFDIIDQLTYELERRERIFSKNGWVKLTDVPVTVFMPAIFVIIDEFAQMSQIIMETSINGLSKNYTLKLENLLSKGAALGFKFIFASQTYSDGVVGLTQTARKQIQVRFALKSVEEEIRETLLLSSSVNEELNQQIRSLPQYETLFRRTDSNGKTRISHLRNLYVTKEETKSVIIELRNSLNATNTYSENPRLYRSKSPVLMDGGKPISFESQKEMFRAYEYNDTIGIEDGEAYIYPGVKCSFNPLACFVLRKANMENVLVCEGIPEFRMSVLLSIMKCYRRRGGKIEIWTEESSLFYRRYKSFFKSFDIYMGVCAIGKRVLEIQKIIKENETIDTLVICFNYENLVDEFDYIEIEDYQLPSPQDSTDDLLERMDSIEQQLSQCTDDDMNKLLEEYEKLRNQFNNKTGNNDTVDVNAINEEVRKTPEYLIKLLKKGGSHGLHFLFSFDSAEDYTQLRIQPLLFRHKILFSVSEESSYDILGNKAGSRIDDHVFLYCNGKTHTTCHPHIHKQLGLAGWKINEDGQVVQEE